LVEPLGLRLADTSAWHIGSKPEVFPMWEQALAGLLVVSCKQVDLELLFSARSGADYDALKNRLSALEHIPCGEAIFERAIEVQGLLAHRKALHHRSVKIADLVIAAAAEKAGLPVWHYDEDFDRVAEVTGQQTAWIVPRGSV